MSWENIGVEMVIATLVAALVAFVYENIRSALGKELRGPFDPPYVYWLPPFGMLGAIVAIIGMAVESFRD